MPTNIRISYAERPVTRDEREIAGILETAITIINSSEPGRLAEIYAPEAVIGLPFGKECLSRAAYLERMKSRRWPIGIFSISDALIRVRSPAEASVACIFRFVPRSPRRSKIASRLFHFQKQHGVWKIINAYDF